MATITDVRSCTVRIPLPTPMAFATRAVQSRDFTLVTVTSDTGTTGTGFCYSGSTSGAMVSTAVTDLLAPLAVGQDPYRVEGLWQAMYQEALLHGRAGAVMRALSALDIALWDHNARDLGLPLWRLLGGPFEDSVPAYASGGYYYDGKTSDLLAAEIRGYVDQGFRAVKIKVGRLDAAGDEERVAAVREAVGPNVRVMLDANNAWQDLPTALRAVRRFEKHDPYWIEEPFSPDDIDNHARLARSTPVTVATGEIEVGRWRHKELLQAQAAHILQTDAAVAGGITEWRRIAATAASHGVPMAPHWFHDLHIHLVASAPNGMFVEFFPDNTVLNLRDIMDGELQVKDGRLVLPTTPGLGFSWDDDAVARYQLTPWQSPK